MINLLHSITLLAIGFSIISALLLFAVYLFFLKGIRKTPIAVFSCFGLLLCLILLQFEHMRFLLSGEDLIATQWYRFWLFLAPTFFFFFGRVVVLPEARWPPWMVLHFSPLILNYTLRFEISVPLLFLIGMGYSFWLAHLIYGLRGQRQRFKFEMFFFVLFSLTAVFVLVLGIALPYIDHGSFYVFYADSIALAFALIVGALLAFPDLLSDIADVTRMRYAATTLNGINVAERMAQLDKLMADSELYKNENLNLSLLAEALGLSSHQLSELINTQLNVGFSRYIREVRIEAAKRMLAQEPESSVLAVSVATGFKTQSNFYTAFNEIVGVSPGAYRKSLSSARK